MKQALHTILVIDDQYESRKDTYEKVLGEDFIILTIQSSAEIYDTIARTVADAYLVDIVLTYWVDPITGKPVDTMNVLRRLNRQVPVILVSNEFGNVLKEDELTSFMNQIIHEPIRYTVFFTWGQFLKAAMANNLATRIHWAVVITGVTVPSSFCWCTATWGG